MNELDRLFMEIKQNEDDENEVLYFKLNILVIGHVIKYIFFLILTQRNEDRRSSGFETDEEAIDYYSHLYNDDDD
jgi:hypothetical protein